MAADLFTSRLMGRRNSEVYAPPALTYGYIPHLTGEKTRPVVFEAHHFKKPNIPLASMKKHVALRVNNPTRRASIDLLEMLAPIAAEKFPRFVGCDLPSQTANDRLKQRYPIPDDAPLLGKGGYGKVVLVEDQKTKKKVAAKVNLEGTQFDLEELVKLNRVQGLPYVIALLNHFQLNEDQHVLILEAVGENLSTELRELGNKNNHMPLEKINDFMRKFLTCLAALHKAGITHCDLKTSNLFYSLTTGMMRVLDFGLSKHKDKDDFTDRVCNIQYRAPEVCLGAKYGTAVDIWSAGCILFRMFTNDYLFPDYSDAPIVNVSEETLTDPKLIQEARHLSLVQQICGAIPPRLIMEGDRADQFFGELPGYQYTFLFEPECPKSSIGEKIAAVNEVRKDPSTEMNDLFDLLGKMLDPDPTTRITAEDALKHRFLQKKPAAPLQPIKV